MKNKCLLLVKNRLVAQLGINTLRYEKDKRKRNNRLLLWVVIIFLILMGAGYCGGFAYGMCYMGFGAIVPLYGFFLCSMITFVFTVFKSNGELFAYKDYEILMSLPFKTGTVIASRFLNMYLWNTFLTMIVMAPMGIIYGIMEKPEMKFCLVWCSGILLASLIPTTIAAVIGAIITAISSKFRHSNMVSTIVTLIFACALIALPFSLGKSGGGFFAETGELDEKYISTLLPKLTDTLESTYLPGKWYQDAVEGNYVSLLVLIVVSLGIYFLFVGLLTSGYKKMNTSITTYHMRSDYRVTELKKGTTLQALYQKELKRLLSSTIYITNTGIGVVMAVIFSITFLIVGKDKILEIVQVENVAYLGTRMTGIVPYVVAVMLSLTCTACSSLSLEGKNLWILQSLPITTKQVYDSKILVNLTLTLPSSLLCAILLSIAMKPGVLGGILYFLIPAIFSILDAIFGMFVNILLPNYQWENEAQVVKQSAASMLGTLSVMLLCVICAIITNVLPVDYRISSIVILVVVGVASLIIYRKIGNRNRL